MHKDPGEEKKKEKKKKKPNKGILLMELNNGVVWGSHGHGCVGFPWMCMWGWHVVPIDGEQETHGWCIDEVKSPLGKGEWVGLVHGPHRGLEGQGEAETHTWGGDCWVWMKSYIE